MAVSTIDALYHSGSEKLATTSTGVDVTGGVSIDDDNNFSFGDGTAYIQGSGANDRLKFVTNNSEALRIDSSGRLLLGTSTSFADGNSGNLQIAGSANTGMMIKSGSAAYGSIYFGDATSGSARNAGIVRYFHNDNSMQFWTNETERMRVLSSGGITFNGDTAAANALNDYEEGTFTLSLNGVSGGAFGVGLYVKVGGLVHFQWYSNGAVTVSSSTGGFVGLPFTTASGAYYATFSSSHNTYTPNASGGYLNTGTNSGVFTNNGTVSSAPTSAGSGRYLMVAGTYKTNA